MTKHAIKTLNESSETDNLLTLAFLKTNPANTHEQKVDVGLDKSSIFYTTVIRIIFDTLL